ncbi:DUF5916 domain-containing protein [uncultured Hymenobacter sp.]|uniref:DUF5916 domain-containing protein n=1 Tax=uncultured Hymenobacter sp. TaxID=170016 RepID=UPI0035CC17F8
MARIATLRVWLLLSWLSGWLGGSPLHAQTPTPAPVAAGPTPPAAAGPVVRRQLQAVRIQGEAPKLDGLLDEAVWQSAPVTEPFVEQEPRPGQVEKHRTEVRVLYDDAAIYIGAHLHDVAQDSILRELSQRDDIGNSDWFGVFFDTYHDKLNGYSFIVTPGGVQVDARYSPAGGEDGNWNAVWDSRTALRGTDWLAELRIPYSAIRFSSVEEQLWGLNFGRQRRSTRQVFFWNPVVPTVDGFVNQWGELTGIRGIKPPLRLSLTPYVSAYLNHGPTQEAQDRSTTSTSFNGGADIKWGINESFTLDATLVPDFGQVQSDNQVLNLSPFEVKFNENRQFFTEGTELFNKGDLFYSRRVGGQPMGYDQVSLNENEKLVENPGVTRLLNATKVSGRTSKGLGVGVFNAISNDIFAVVRNEGSGEKRQILTQPRTNYNIFVLDQSLKNNSYISLINTNVLRQGSTYDANVTGGLLRLADKKNKYALDVRGFYSRRRGQAFGSDADISNRDGYKYFLSYGKISGNFTWSVDHGIESDTYDPNDLGLLFSNNNISQSVNLGYGIYKPFWKLNRLSVNGGYYNSYLYKPARYADNGLFFNLNAATKKFISFGFGMNGPLAARHDFFEPRRRPLGRYFVRIPPSWGGGPYLSTDYRKPLALDVSAWVRAVADDKATGRTGRRLYELALSPRWRVNNQLNFRYEVSYSSSRNNIGYVNDGLSFHDGDGKVLAEDMRLLTAFGYRDLDGERYGERDGDALLGRRRINTVTNTLSAAYTFTNRMSFTIRGRHYVSNVHYRDFSRLAPDGQETPVEYQRNRDNTYNAFNIDAVFSWWFAPGSQVSVVWKDAAQSFLQGEEATPLYFSNLNGTINTLHNNNLSIKVLYYLDYLTLRPKRGVGN